MSNIITEDEALNNDGMLYGDRLAEGKWVEWVDGIESREMRSSTAILLENEQQYIRNFVRQAQPYAPQFLTETTMLSHPGIATLETQLLPIIRGALPNTVSSEIFSVQPMTSEASMIYYITFQHGTTKGSITKGDPLFDNFDKNYSSETIEDEEIGTGDGTTTPTVSALDFGNVRKGSLLITDGLLTVRDNGAGAFTGDSAAGTVDYVTGTITGLTWSGNTDDGSPITANYEIETEGSADIPQLDMVITSSLIRAKKRKLRYRYSSEAQISMNQHHNIDPEQEMNQIAAEQMKFEIDRELIDIARRHAKGGYVEFSKSSPTGVSWQEHKMAFVDTLVAGGNKIFQKTERVEANWVILGQDAANIVETMPNFVSSGIVGGRGIKKIGVLANKWVCYKDPKFATDEFLLGYKGNNITETALVYAPFIPFFATDRITLDDFISRRGVGTFYGRKLIDPKLFVLGSIIS